MIKRLTTAAALLGALLLVPAPARAQDDVTLTMARERFKEGVGYFDKKDFAKARVAFLQAYALKKHPAVLLNLAQSELRSGHEADAAKHFAQYLREHKDATEAERQGAETGLTAAKALVAEVTLEVDSTGAEVYVDGDLEGQVPLPGSIYLSLGSHQIEARRDGKTASTTVNASAGQSHSVKLKMAAGTKQARARAAPSGSGEQPAAPEETPPEEPEPPRERAGFGRWLVNTPTAMIGAGLAGVGIIGGAAFALGSKASYDAANSVAAGIEKNAVETDMKPSPKGVCVKIEDWLRNESLPVYKMNEAELQDRVRQYQDNCDKYQDNVNSGDTFKKLAIVGFAVGGAAAVGTIIYYFADPTVESSSQGKSRGKRQRRVVVVPLYEPGYAGALISGSF
ncbi:MAG TPA: hypothetical protein VJN18_22085 [Polyangiaceae bacterium]|nr:hypothetical protein [Polyangiaceae bacterium]